MVHTENSAEVNHKSHVHHRSTSPIFVEPSPSPQASHKRPRYSESEDELDTHGFPTKKKKPLIRKDTVKLGNSNSNEDSRSMRSSTEEAGSVQHVSSSKVPDSTLGWAEITRGTRAVDMARGSPSSSTSPGIRPRGPSRSHTEHNSKQNGHRQSDFKTDQRHQLLRSIGMTEVLQEDDRPTFIIDTDDHDPASDTLDLVYANPALRHQPGLLEYIHGTSDDPTQMLQIESDFLSFKEWATGRRPASDDAADQHKTFVFADFDWAYSVVRKRLRIFRGRYVPELPVKPGQRPNYQLYKPRPSSNKTRQLDIASPGYFGLNPSSSSKRAETPGALESLMHTQESSEHISEEGDEALASPLTNGDSGMGELISNALSPRSEQRTLPAPNAVEGFGVPFASHFSDNGFFDWTRLPDLPSLPSHVHFARSVDWASTSLGPMEEWSSDLRGMCNLIMASPHPAAMYWGSEHVAIYNEPYILLAGNKHPSLMGMRYQDAWVEIWHAIEDVFASAMTSAQATMKDDDCLFIERSGYLEECYFSWSIIPLIGADGTVVGLYNPAFEKTRRKIAERRMLTLRHIGEKTASARKVSEFWGLLLEGLEYNEFDAPLVVVYSLQDENSDSELTSVNGLDTISTTSSQASRRLCHFEGALGLYAGHPAAPALVDLKTGNEGFAPYFRQAMNTHKPVVLREEDGTLDACLLEDVEWHRGFRDPSRVVVVSPIHPTTGDSTLGFLIMGTNPRRPYDEDYDLFVQLLGRQLATSMASVVLFEEEIRKGEKAAMMAAQDRIELSNQLAQRTQEAIESENKFTRMAELAPVGMFMADSSGNIIFTNSTWYDLAQYPRNTPVAHDWIYYIKEEDQERCRKAWDSVVNDFTPVSLEFRFKHPWRDEFGNTGEMWVLASSFPEVTPEGKLKGIFGSVTNISTQKFAEGLQKNRASEALEMKRQQENFVDITSKLVPYLYFLCGIC
jgi:PAS domain S-box-containing protein